MLTLIRIYEKSIDFTTVCLIESCDFYSPLDFKYEIIHFCTPINPDLRHPPLELINQVIPGVRD